jgi:hypothetical protein
MQKMTKIQANKMRPDKIHKVKIHISGFTRVQAEEGLPDLLDEMRSRAWLFDPQAFWDNSINKLVIIVGYEFEERVEDGAFDEISDCVIATMEFDEEISFDVARV